MMQSQGVLGVERMCQATGVSRAGFYRRWEERAPDEAGMALRDAIQRASVEHPRYGAAKVAEVLRRGGLVVSVARVQRVRREDNLLAIRRRRFVVTTDSDHEFLVYPNLAQYMVLTAVNQLWVADITYIRLASEFVYLAVVLDAFSRRAVGWSLSQSLQTKLPLAALNLAITARQPAPGLVHHSDRGSQYASDDYVSRLEKCKITVSMSRPARPWKTRNASDSCGPSKRRKSTAGSTARWWNWSGTSKILSSAITTKFDCMPPWAIALRLNSNNSKSGSRPDPGCPGYLRR